MELLSEDEALEGLSDVKDGHLDERFAVCKQNSCPCTLWEVAIAALPPPLSYFN